LTAIGMALFIIPGVYFAVVFNLSLTAVVVVEHAGPRRCVELVSPRFAATFGRVFALGLFAGCYGLLAESAANLTVGPASVPGAVLQAVLLIPMGVASTAAVAVTYVWLRRAEQPLASTASLDAQMTWR